MSDRAPQLIASLANFRLRSQAKRELVALGHEAVQDLLDALPAADQAVLWCLVTALGRIRDPKAVPPLVDLLDSDRISRSDVISALESITGRDFGDDIAKWRELRPAPAHAQPAAPASPEALVREALRDTDIAIRTAGSSVTCDVHLPSGRSQKVRVYPTRDPDGEDLLAFYTECGPVDPARYEWALRKNMRIPFGRYGIRDLDGKPTFVMVAVLPRDSVRPADVRKCIDTLAEKGDRLETFLREEDLA